MSDSPQVLLAHHLKALRLPTFLREYEAGDVTESRRGRVGRDMVCTDNRLLGFYTLLVSPKRARKMAVTTKPSRSAQQISVTTLKAREKCLRNHSENGPVQGIGCPPDAKPAPPGAAGATGSAMRSDQSDQIP